MNEQEAVWIDEARAGNKRSFSCLVEAYQRPVYNLTYRMLGSPEEAEDAAQEVFLRAYSRLEQYDPSHKFSTWLFSIANHHCIDRLRKRRKTFVSIDDNPVLQNLQNEAPEPEENILDAEQASELQHLLTQLEPEYRTPLVLRYWEEYSYEEIAEAMELTVSAVKSRLFRARKQMAELYATQSEPVPPLSRTPSPKETRQQKQDSAMSSSPFLRTAFAM
ncbi:MAG: sigma-70 family RNA polymerase sigma factor [Caldilineaceae bacterium]|nr:sigma-70 family RNA polymerase sigma factor [Caldilineaceae bacterium]